MSGHRINVVHENGKIPNWLIKSMFAMDSIVLNGVFKYDDFATHYGVKLIVNDHSIEAIEFPNENEAIMFILRWS